VNWRDALILYVIEVVCASGLPQAAPKKGTKLLLAAKDRQIRDLKEENKKRREEINRLLGKL